jgi:hypothetical protein
MKMITLAIVILIIASFPPLLGCVAAGEEKTAWEDYNNSAYWEQWEATHPDLTVQLTPKQAAEFIIFRESNAEKAKRGGMKAITIVQAIDGVVEANREGTLAVSDEMNTSLKLLQELAPENCGNGSAIQIFAQNYRSWSHGGPHICAPCAMCWDPVNNPINGNCDDSLAPQFS